MKLFLSPRCESITGALNKKFGYTIQRRKDAFYGVRCNNRIIPPDGHWRFILHCAQLESTRLYINDIRVAQSELHDALSEAQHSIAAQQLRKKIYNARDIIKPSNAKHQTLKRSAAPINF